jgi:hypothetical protein
LDCGGGISGAIPGHGLAKALPILLSMRRKADER